MRRIIQQPKAVSANRLAFLKKFLVILGSSSTAQSSNFCYYYHFPTVIFLTTNAWILLYRYQIVMTQTSEFLCYRCRTTTKRWASEVIYLQMTDRVDGTVESSIFYHTGKSFPQCHSNKAPGICGENICNNPVTISNVLHPGTRV